jgi:toxin FitB
MFLLDTNVISELRRTKPHGAVSKWIESISASDLFVAAATMGEIQAGIELTRERDLAKALEIEQWLEDVSKSVNVLPLGGQTFRLWAKLMHRKPQALYEDAMIASVAIENKLTVATRNVADFKVFKVPTFNPFK